MTHKKKIFAALLIIFFGIGCVSIERDLYFRDKNQSVSWSSSAPQPGVLFHSESILLDSDGSITLHTEVVNRAEGSYFWGFIVPVVPVFFLPQFQFHLNKNENLKIHCTVSYAPDNRYLKKDPKKDWYFLSEEGIRISEERLKKGYDTCGTMELTLSDGTEVKPIAVTTEKGNSFFEFKYPIEKISEFTFVITEIQLSDGRMKKINTQFQAVFEDFMRYYIVQIAP